MSIIDAGVQVSGCDSSRYQHGQITGGQGRSGEGTGDPVKERRP